MNDILQQLISMGPGIGAAVGGNSEAFAAFMEGYQRTMQQLEQQKRLKQRDALALEDRQLALEDRQRGMRRQDEADQFTRTSRQQQQALQGMQIPGHLAEMGAAGDTPQDAQAIIEAAMPNLMKAFGQESMAYGQPAVEMAQRTITGRQKAEVKAYIKEAVESEHVKANPESDPEIQLTPRMQKITGKPSMRLTELQAFADMAPVGKPAGKTRVPAAAGSFEEYSDPATPPDRKAQIEKDRKAYMQADDKPTVNVTLPGGISTKAGDAALKFQDDYARDSKPYLTMREAYQRVKSAAAKPDAAGDLSMIFAYMKMLDPNSVVREQEFANAQNAAGVPDRVRNLYNQVMKGNRLNPTQRDQFVAQADALFENAKTNQRGVRTTYGSRAKQWGIPDSMVLDEEDEFMRPQSSPATDAAGRRRAKDGERRKFGDELREWREATQEWVKVNLGGQ